MTEDLAQSVPSQPKDKLAALVAVAAKAAPVEGHCSAELLEKMQGPGLRRADALPAPG